MILTKNRQQNGVGEPNEENTQPVGPGELLRPVFRVDQGPREHYRATEQAHYEGHHHETPI